MKLANQLFEFSQIVRKIDTEKLQEIAHIIENTIQNNGSIYICGNGGSGSSANLFASLLLQVGLFFNLRVNAVSFNSNMVIISALACQYGYQNIFKLQLQVGITQNVINRNDLLIVISGSGNSPNILEAAKFAKKIGITVLGLTGLKGGQLTRFADHVLHAPSENMQQIENIHCIYINSIIQWLQKCLKDNLVFHSEGYGVNQAENVFIDYLESICRLILVTNVEAISLIKKELLRAGKNRNTVFIIGNGISSAISGHFANDLAKKASENLVIDFGYRLNALVLTESMPFLTAVANDQSLEDIFVESLKLNSHEEDLLFILSSSRPHENIIKAVRYAKEKGLKIISLTGADLGTLEQFADISYCIKSYRVDLVEATLSFLCHYLTEALSNELKRLCERRQFISV